MSPEKNPLVAISHSVVREDEKMLLQACRELNVEPIRIHPRKLTVDSEGKISLFPDGNLPAAALIRNISSLMGLEIARSLEFLSIPTINSVAVAETCINKAETTWALARKHIPQPKTIIAYDKQQALTAMEQIGFPVVFKPLVGSWGRGLNLINNPTEAQAFIESDKRKGSLGSIFYLQEYINKPKRDIRVFVIGNEPIGAIYRESENWITNTALGGKATNCPITSELGKLAVEAANAVGGGVLAVDIMEDPNKGLVVCEINHTMEFKNSVDTTGVKIPKLIILHLLAVARGEIKT